MHILENDFIGILPEEYSREVLKIPFPVKVFYDHWLPPKPELFETLLSRFQGGFITVGEDNTERGIPSGVEELIRIAGKHPEYLLTVYVNIDRFKPDEYGDFRDLVSLMKIRPFYICSNSNWYSTTRFPVLTGDAPFLPDGEFLHFLNLAKKFNLHDYSPLCYNILS